jgi:hypothetical protein
MSDHKPQRVRVTGPPRYASGPRNRLGDVHEQTPLGDVFLRSLLKEQLALAIRVLAVLGLTLGLLPLAFHLWPGLGEAELADLPVAWLVLGVLVYPFLLLLGWRYVRSVERNERDFADLVAGSEHAEHPAP